MLRTLWHLLKSNSWFNFNNAWKWLQIVVEVLTQWCWNNASFDALAKGIKMEKPTTNYLRAVRASAKKYVISYCFCDQFSPPLIELGTLITTCVPHLRHFFPTVTLAICRPNTWPYRRLFTNSCSGWVSSGINFERRVNKIRSLFNFLNWYWRVLKPSVIEKVVIETELEVYFCQ